MTIIHSCLFWKSLNTGSLASAVFSITISSVQILLQIALWTGNKTSDQVVMNSQYMVYVPLAALDLLLILFAILMIMGLEKINQSRLIGTKNELEYSGGHLLLPWLGLAIIYVLYEVSINVYFFYVAFSVTTVPGFVPPNGSEPMPHGNAWGTDILPELIVLVVYWGLKLIIYLFAIVCVYSYYKELRAVYVKEKMARGPFQYPGAFYNDMTRNEQASQRPENNAEFYPENDPYRQRPQEYDTRHQRQFYGPDRNQNENANDRFYRLDPNLLQSREDINRMYTDASRRMPPNQYYEREESVPYNEFGYVGVRSFY